VRLRQIEVFHAIYSTGSMTNAAALLCVSQPSVSKVLAHAEQQLGYRLFDRVRGKLVPTPEAHRLFGHVSAVYRNVDRLRHVAENLRSGGSGRIRIASTPAFGLELLPQAVTDFRKSNPETVFEIETLHLDEMTDALLESRVDIGLAFEPAAMPGIVEETLARSRFVVLTPPDVDLGADGPVSIEAISDYPFIGLNSRGPLGRALSAFLDSRDEQLDVVAWSETYHVARALVAAGAGVTIADEITARSTGPGKVRVYPLASELHFEIKALRLDATPLSVVANTFVEHLERAVTAFLDSGTESP